MANLQADGIAQVATSPASVFVGLANVVYDGYAGASAPIAGATLTLVDPATKKPIALPNVLSSSLIVPFLPSAARRTVSSAGSS